MKYHLFKPENDSLIIKIINCDTEETVMFLIEDNAADMLARLVEAINKGHYDCFTNSKIVIQEVQA